jgi:hypothetical protein
MTSTETYFHAHVDFFVCELFAVGEPATAHKSARTGATLSGD